MKKRVKIIILIVCVAVGCGVGGAIALSPLTVDTRVLQPGTATLTFTEQGTYDYDERRQVFPLVAGEVLEILVKEGDVVDQGDVLAVVSASDYQYQIEQLNSVIDGYNAQIVGVNQQDQQRIDELNATLENLQGQVTSLTAEQQKNRENDRSLSTQIEIQERLVQNQRRMLSDFQKYYTGVWEYGETDMTAEERQSYNSIRSSLYQAELALEQLYAGNTPDDIYEGQMQSLQSQIDLVLEQLEKSYSGGTRQYYSAQIAAAQANIAQMEEKAGQAEIVAPIAGTVSELPVKNANVTTQQSHVATIGTGGRVEVFVPVREIDGVAPGDTVELILDKRLGKETLTGTVVEVEGEAHVRLSALGVEERKIRVLIQPDQPGLTIGYDMDVRFTVYTRENALVVPKTAVFADEGADWVWVVEDGVIQSRQVETGIETRDGILVESGLSPDDAVVIDADNASLHAGKRARLSR